MVFLMVVDGYCCCCWLSSTWRGSRSRAKHSRSGNNACCLMCCIEAKRKRDSEARHNSNSRNLTKPHFDAEAHKEDVELLKAQESRHQMALRLIIALSSLANMTLEARCRWQRQAGNIEVFPSRSLLLLLLLLLGVVIVL